MSAIDCVMFEMKIQLCTMSLTNTFTICTTGCKELT